MKTVFTIFLLFVVLQTTMSTLGGTRVTIITVENSCEEIIIVAAVSTPSSPELRAEATGFGIFPKELVNVFVPSNWSGHLWARTGCDFNRRPFACRTGDCGSHAVACPRGTPVPPATTVAHFEADAADPSSESYSFYVSKVTGFNLPVEVLPEGGVGDRCNRTGCVGLYPIKSCPEELRVLGGDGEIMGCNIAPSDVMRCHSANYHMEFCPNTSCKHDSSTEMANLSRHMEYGTEEPKGTKGSVRRILGIVLGIGASALVSVLCWHFFPTGGCCNGNKFYIFFGTVNPITTHNINTNVP